MDNQIIGALKPADAADLLIVEAVAFCRGIEGKILRYPEAFDGTHAVELLKFAARIQEAA